MKLLIIVAMLVAGSGVAAQLSAGMHAGTSDKKVLAGMQMLYQFKNRFTAGVNMTAFTNTSSPAFFQSRLGYSIGNSRNGFSVLPYAGYSYGIQYMDKKNPGGHITAGVQLRYQLNAVAMIYSDINAPAPDMCLFTIGLAGRLPLRYECR